MNILNIYKSYLHKYSNGVILVTVSTGVKNALRTDLSGLDRHASYVPLGLR